MKAHSRVEATNRMAQPKPAPARTAKAVRTMVGMLALPCIYDATNLNAARQLAVLHVTFRRQVR